jgi:hypothetical protein
MDHCFFDTGTEARLGDENPQLRRSLGETILREHEVKCIIIEWVERKPWGQLGEVIEFA